MGDPGALESFSTSPKLRPSVAHIPPGPWQPDMPFLAMQVLKISHIFSCLTETGGENPSERERERERAPASRSFGLMGESTPKLKKGTTVP